MYKYYQQQQLSTTTDREASISRLHARESRIRQNVHPAAQARDVVTSLTFASTLLQLKKMEVLYGNPPPLPADVRVRVYNMEYCPFAQVSARSSSDHVIMQMRHAVSNLCSEDSPGSQCKGHQVRCDKLLFGAQQAAVSEGCEPEWGGPCLAT